MIPPLIPPQGPLGQLIHGPQPSPPEPTAGADDDIVYGLCTVGEAGRVVDRYLFDTLDWRPGTRLRIEQADNVLLVSPDSDGPICVTAYGYFRVPFRQRRRIGLLIGDRVLLTGRRSHGRLLLHPPAALTILLTDRLTLLER